MRFKFCQKQVFWYFLRKNILRSANVLCALGVVFWLRGGAGAWPSTTCQSCCLGNVENSIDSFLVMTATGFSHPRAAEIRKREIWFCSLSGVSRRPLSVSHFSLRVVFSRLQKLFEFFFSIICLFGSFLFNRPTWRLFPRDSPVLLRAATGSRDACLSFSAASPSLPPPVSDV